MVLTRSNLLLLGFSNELPFWGSSLVSAELGPSRLIIIVIIIIIIINNSIIV